MVFFDFNGGWDSWDGLDDDVDWPLLYFEAVNDTNSPQFCFCNEGLIQKGLLSLLFTWFLRYTSLGSFFALAVAIMCLQNDLPKSS